LIGGKLLGAGGGGFLLLYVENKYQQSVIDALSELFCLPIGFDEGGTRITYYDQSMEFITLTYTLIFYEFHRLIIISYTSPSFIKPNRKAE
jgi:hypothetical protein